MKKHSYTYGIQRISLNGEPILVETDIDYGSSSFSIIGLPDKSVEEAKERVASALKHSGIERGKKGEKITISLAPGDLKKTGSLFDVPIALSYLSARGLVNFERDSKIFIGELSLNGDVKKTKGILPLILGAREKGFLEVYIPRENIEEASLIDGIKIFPVDNLKELIDHLNEKGFIRPVIAEYEEDVMNENMTMHFIKGQESVKRALTIAACGGHNIALYGPPGTGKTLLAKSIPGLLPKLTKKESIESTSIHSIVSDVGIKPIKFPPFRSPHHSSSYSAIVGGGANLSPGEISLAHNGVLFMDEFPEFDRRVIESLREPLEEHSVSITRASGSVKFPASCILIIAFNLCPCGNTGTDKPCVCSFSKKSSYYRKLSGPIADRIDMWVSVEASNFETIEKETTQKDLEEALLIKKGVKKGREFQKERFKDSKITLNAEMGIEEIEKYSKITKEAQRVLKSTAEKLSISPRGYHRIIKCARTIADLKQKEHIEEDDILEAVSYRTLPEIF